MDKGGTIKRNTYFVSIAQIIQMLLAFALVPFAARYLGDDGFGKYALATTIMYFIFLLNDLGVNTLVTREVAKDKVAAQSYFGNSLSLKAMLIIGIIIFLSLFFKFFKFSSEMIFAIIIFGIYGIVTSFVQLSTGVFRAFEKMEYETIVLILEKAIIAGIGILVLVMSLGLLAFAAVFVLAGFISVIICFAILRNKFFPIKMLFEPIFMKRILFSSLAMGASLFMVSIYCRVDILMLSAMKSPDVVGWYAAAYKLISITAIIPNILITATFPRFSQYSKGFEKEFSELFTKGLKYLIFFALPLISGTIILSEKIIFVVFGLEFTNAVVALRILVWAAGLNFLNIFLNGIFIATSHQNKLVAIYAAGLMSNILLNTILIPKYSYLGASTATVFTELTVFSILMYIALYKITQIVEKMFIIKALLATLIMSLFLFYFQAYNIFVITTLSMIVYFVSLHIFKALVLQEILILPKNLIR